MSQYDCVVIGAGFGGLGAALQLAEQGAKVAVVEALKYAGGCAATFQRGRYRFEAGATLFSGFDEGQLFHKWKKKYQWPLEFQKLNPIISFRGSEMNTFDIPPNRDQLCALWCQRHPEHNDGLRKFFNLQKRVSNALWPIFDNPQRLPPLSFDSTGWHLSRLLQYPELLTLINTPLIKVLKRYGLEQLSPFVEYCNALCQITIQTSVLNAEAPFALSTLDYLFRGTGHIWGGVGELTKAMLRTLTDHGVDVHLSTKVQKIKQMNGIWQVEARKKQFSSRAVIANLTPHALSSLLEVPPPELAAQAKSVEKGWGAVMLYLVIKNSPNLPQKAIHVQCINDPSKTLDSGNHVFCSISAAEEKGRAPSGERTATVSTHLSMSDFMAMTDTEKAERVQNIQDQMKRTLSLRMPELDLQIQSVLPASPRTFERFTKRVHGYVGGIPKTTGFHNYTGIFPRQTLANLWMVGDSVFPGQSTLATAVGGCRTANAVLKKSGILKRRELENVAVKIAKTHS